MITCLVDTDVLIDASRRVDAARRFLEAQERRGDLGISVITQMELLVGCRNRSEMREVNRFLQRFEIIPVNGFISDLAVRFVARYRLTFGLLIPDALIAATACVGGYPLVTNNRKHFQNIRGLKLLAVPLFNLS